METPEARGVGKAGRIEVAGVLMGTDLNEQPTREGGVPQTQAALVPSLGYAMPVSNQVDVGVRIQPMAPLSLRLKYQFAGTSEAEGKLGFAAAAVVSPGILLGKNGSTATRLLSFDTAFPLGYRIRERHLFFLAPFFTYASLSGTTETGATASIFQYGSGLGHQYTLDALYLRTELTLAKGAMGDSTIGDFYFGALFGFLLE
ncbi:MAG: hypothetical protein NDJ90_16140 [Oligoflexia bacterium]|nr:hypothetical protein [Oligoflexia bacterium]